MIITRSRAILLGLSIHFACWWALSAWFWTTRFRFNIWAALAPIAPIYLGFFYLQPHGVWQWAVEGLLVSAALIGVTIVAVRKARLWLVISAHATMLIYWFVGFHLIATGV